MAIPTKLNNKQSPLQLTPPGCRCYSTIYDIAATCSSTSTAKMARKQQRIEGLSNTEEHYQINKQLGRPRKHHTPIAKKILATDHYLKLGKAAQEVENELGIPGSSVRRIAAQARQCAKENHRPLEDISNYQEASGRGRKEVFSSSQADVLAKYVFSCRDCRMKTAQEHIVDLELPISVSAFQNLMYERFFSMTRCASESHQSWQSGDAHI